MIRMFIRLILLLSMGNKVNTEISGSIVPDRVPDELSYRLTHTVCFRTVAKETKIIFSMSKDTKTGGLCEDFPRTFPHPLQ